MTRMKDEKKYLSSYILRREMMRKMLSCAKDAVIRHDNSRQQRQRTLPPLYSNRKKKCVVIYTRYKNFIFYYFFDKIKICAYNGIVSTEIRDIIKCSKASGTILNNHMYNNYFAILYNNVLYVGVSSFILSLSYPCITFVNTFYIFQFFKRR